MLGMVPQIFKVVKRRKRKEGRKRKKEKKSKSKYILAAKIL